MLAPVAVCGDHVYILGESSMYTSSVVTLIQSCKSFLASFWNRDTGIWSEIAAPPVTQTTCMSIHGRLLAIGGKNSYGKRTTAVHVYNPATDSWKVISHMGTARWDCTAAVLPNNQLMVVGGCTYEDSVEFAFVE